jgi:RNA 3'-terminal phosphate cyclase
VIYAFIKDGLTVYGFEDAGELRQIMHDRPGHKPQGGGTVDARHFARDRDTVKLTDLGIEKLRYLARSSVSHVVEREA